jgi:raffinose/stachyose/melibiose transport system permease protein
MGKKISSKSLSTLRIVYKSRIAYLFLLPAIFFIGLFIIYPLFRGLFLSFFSWNGLTDPVFIGLTNFKNLINDRSILLALRNNLIFSVLTTVGTVGIGFLLAIAIERQVWGWPFLKVIYFLPVMMSMTVVGILWSRILDPSYGLINVLLKFLGFSNPPNWLGDPNIAIFTIIAVTIWQFSGFPMIVFLAAIENIPLDLHDAATIDGVNTIQRIFHIIIPLIKPVMVMLVMLQIIFSFKVFDIIWVMTAGGPGDASTVLGVHLYRVAFRYTEYGYGSAVAVLMTAIIFTFSLIYLKFIRTEELEYY